MKLTKLLIISATLAVIGAIGVWSTTASASKFVTQDSSRLASDQTVDGSYYASGDRVTVDGTVNGDVYCAASSVTVSGTINGDLLCAAQSITVDGTVNGDVRVAGQTLDLAGTVKGSLNAFGASVSSQSDFKLGGDATIGASNATLDGQFGRDVVISGNLVRLKGQVARDLNLQGSQLSFGQDGHIAGDLDYTASSQLQIDKQQVAGVVRQNQPDDSKASSGSSFQGVLSTIIVTVAMIIIYPLLVPRLANRINQTSQRDMFYTMLVGIATLVGLPAAAILVMLTIVGIPLGIVLLLTMLLAIIIGLAQAAVWLGRLLLGSATPNIILQSLGGALALAIAMQIPIVGILVGIAWLVVGTGLVARHIAVTVFARPNYAVDNSSARPAKKSK